MKVNHLIGSYAYELASRYGAGKVHIVYYISLLEPYYKHDILGEHSPNWQPVVDLADDK